MNEQQIVPLNNAQQLIINSGLGVTAVQNTINLGRMVYQNVPEFSLEDVSTQVNQYIDEAHNNFNQLRELMTYNQAMGPQGIPLSVLEEQSRKRPRLTTKTKIISYRNIMEGALLNIIYLVPGASLK